MNKRTVTLDDLHPQTKDELDIARSLLPAELEKRQLTGIPSVDRVWRSYYSDEQLSVQAPQMSMSDYLYERNKHRLHLNAFDYMGKKITYEEMFHRIEDTAKRFQKYGVKEADYVNLAMPVSPETIYMVYGLDKIGACASLIDPRVGSERMSYYLQLVNSSLVGITGIYAESMRKAIAERENTTMLNISPLQSFEAGENSLLKLLYACKTAPETLREIAFNLSAASRGNRIVSSKRFYKGNLDDYQLHIPPYKKDRTAIVEYTSGTTGVPKGLELSAASINLVAEQCQHLISSEAGQTMLGIMPPFISYGIVCGTHEVLCRGLESILIPKFQPEIFAELVLKHKPNHIVCVPSYLQLLMRSDLVKQDTDLSHIKNIIVGGNKIGIEFERDFNVWLKEHGCNITVSKGGGMAEYASCLFYTPFESTKKPGVYGLPLPSVDAKIVDESGNELGYYEVGEIHITSAQAMNGYVHNQTATDEFFYTDNCGRKYGRSGDLGYVDINGLFTLLDRKKQMVIRPDGHNVFPSEISAIISDHEAVENCLVAGVQAPEFESGQWPTAFIKLKPEYTDAKNKVLDDIRTLCASKLPLRDRPRDQDYILVKEIILTQEGKTDVAATVKPENIL